MNEHEISAQLGLAEEPRSPRPDFERALRDELLTSDTDRVELSDRRSSDDRMGLPTPISIDDPAARAPARRNTRRGLVLVAASIALVIAVLLGVSQIGGDGSKVEPGSKVQASGIAAACGRFRAEAFPDLDREALVGHNSRITEDDTARARAAFVVLGRELDRLSRDLARAGLTDAQLDDDLSAASGVAASAVIQLDVHDPPNASALAHSVGDQLILVERRLTARSECRGASDGRPRVAPGRHDGDPVDRRVCAQLDLAVAAAHEPSDLAPAKNPWGIPTLQTSVLAHTRTDLERVGTDGRRLYVERLRGGTPIELLRVNPASGAVRARYVYRVPSGSAPWAPGASPAFADSAVVLLDGDREHVRLLDPETLAVRRQVRLPRSSRTELPADRDQAQTVWLGHKRYGADQLAGRFTLMAITRLDLDRSKVAETRAVPVCGTKGGVQPSKRWLVFGVECSYQVEIADLQHDATHVLPGFQVRPEVSLHFGEVWVRWSNVGYLAHLDVEHGTFKTLDLNTEGPRLRSLYAVTSGAGALWVTGIPADPALPRLVFRIDPKTLTVTGRAWTDAPVAVVGGVGYTTRPTQVGLGGPIARFDPASVTRAGPTTVVRPAPLVAPGFKPGTKAERAVLKTFNRVFDIHVSNAAAAPNIEDADELAPVRSDLIKVARTAFSSLQLVVTDLAVDGSHAAVAYSFLLNGSPAFNPLSGRLTRHGDRWIVSRDTICQLAEQAAVDQC